MLGSSSELATNFQYGVDQGDWVYPLSVSEGCPTTRLEESLITFVKMLRGTPVGHQVANGKCLGGAYVWRLHQDRRVLFPLLLGRASSLYARLLSAPTSDT